MKGAFDEMHAKKIASLYSSAIKNGAPVVGIFDSCGAIVYDGVSALAGYGLLMKCVSDASGVIPQIAIIPGVCAGDVVTVFGTDGSETITADEVATKAQTIGYELVCGIAPRVPRVYLKNGEVDSLVRTLPGE